MACCSCSAVSDRVSLLERRVRELEQLLAGNVSIADTDTSASISCGAVSTPVRPSSSVASSAGASGFITVDRWRRTSRSRQSRERTGLHSPFPTVNRFAVLASPASSAPTSPSPVRRGGPGQPRQRSTLVIGDSITRNIRLETPATVCCLPGARVSDIEANLRVLASGRKRQGSQPQSTTTYRNIVIHAGTNNVRLRQSEITKASMVRTLNYARKMCRHRLIVSGPLPVRGSDEMYSRLTAMNRWLARYCREQGLGFVDNWPSFWGRPGLLRADGLHPTGAGAALLSRNIDRALQQV